MKDFLFSVVIGWCPKLIVLQVHHIFLGNTCDSSLPRVALPFAAQKISFEHDCGDVIDILLRSVVVLVGSLNRDEGRTPIQ